MATTSWLTVLKADDERLAEMRRKAEKKARASEEYHRQTAAANIAARTRREVRSVARPQTPVSHGFKHPSFRRRVAERAA